MIRISLRNGYEVVDDTLNGGGFYALKDGEYYRDLLHDGLAAALVAELDEAQTELRGRRSDSTELYRMIFGGGQYENYEEEY